MIYLFITTSINNKVGIVDEEHRMNTYINSITKSLSHLPTTILPIIIENNGKRATFLDSFGIEVFYTNNNKRNCAHKGVNELHDIKDAINHYCIKDEDTIIKLTGRYYVEDNSFFNLAVKNEYDAFVKFFNVCELRFMEYDCVLGLFAIKCKYLKQFEYECISSPEVEFATFVRKNVSNLLEVQEMGLTCCFADDLRILDV